MGNLIIKGKGGAGNKLILQDQAGAAVLTTADSGATIASGVTGGAGLSGMTSLGTVTAGNLSNSAIVYPTGHVVQTTTSLYASTKTTVTSSTGTYQSTVVTGQITPRYNNSSIIVHATFGIHLHGETGSDNGYGLRWHKSGTGATTGYPAEMNMNPHATQSHANFYRNAFQYVSLGDYYSISMINNDCETTNTLTYTLHVARYGSEGSLYAGSNVWNNINWMIYLQEIKR